MKNIKLKNNDWINILSPEEYNILRKKKTELPYSGAYVNFDEFGNYYCAGCGLKLFSSDSKFLSPPPNQGWPAFSQAMDGAIAIYEDTSFGMVRSEIRCAGCDGHLGHLFDDGPANCGGRHYCVNSGAIKFLEH
jgi:peptide-methionine (R)-S-oxide reductase